MLAAIGLDKAALFDQWWERRNGSSWDPTAIYRYANEDGKVLFEVGRFAHPKRFLQRLPGRTAGRAGSVTCAGCSTGCPR